MQKLIALVCLFLATPAFAAPDFFVSPGGDDAWTGALAAPNAAKTDGPFATFARAQQAVRATRKSDPARATPLTVLLRAGTYELAEPISITPEESGSEKSLTVYAAYPDETVTLSAGRRLAGWKVDGDRWTLDLPEVKSGDWSFIQLFVNGRRRYRPRLPKEGYYAIADELPPSPKAEKKGYDRFKYAGEDLRADWYDLNRVEVIGFHVWTMSRLPILSIDDEEKTVTFTGQTRALSDWNKLPKGRRYFVENVREALSPGTFYLDRKTGRLTYMPLPGESPETAEVVAPKLDKLLTFAGDPVQSEHVSHVTLRGLTFAHANWSTPDLGNSFPQAEINVVGAISLLGVRDCVVERCDVRSVGTYAIDVGAGCQRVRIEGCELTDLGAGGVKIGTTFVPGKTSASWNPDKVLEAAAADPATLLTSHVTVRDNLIAHGGRLHPAAVGVWIGQSPHNTIEHNEIFDLYYTGVSMGWTWGYGTALGQNNNISYNHMHALGQRVLSDMGGIYTLGDARGSVLHHNRIHDVHAFDYGGWGIYPDEGTTGLLVENNLVHDTKTGSFHQHYGKENVVRNNVFAFSRQWQIQRTREEEHRSFTFERNIVLWDTGPLLGSNWKNNQYAFDHNLYWRVKDQPIDFSGLTLEQWREKGQDRNSIIADPRFAAPEKGDFTLSPSSPALKLGFVPIDARKIGRLTKSPRPLGKAPPAFPIPPAK